MARHDLDPPSTPVSTDTDASASSLAERHDRRGALLRTIGPLVSLERDWVDTDFISARIWTE